MLDCGKQSLVILNIYKRRAGNIKQSLVTLDIYKRRADKGRGYICTIYYAHRITHVIKTKILIGNTRSRKNYLSGQRENVPFTTGNKERT